MGIPQPADGRPIYSAYYSLTRDGSWVVTVETEHGQVRIDAARLADIERRGYEAVQRHVGHTIGTFDIVFAHRIDLDATEQAPLTA